MEITSETLVLKSTVAHGSVVGSIVEPARKKAREQIPAKTEEDVVSDDEPEADYDRESSAASADAEEVKQQLKEVLDAKLVAEADLEEAQAQCRLAAAELARLKDETEKLRLERAELLDHIADVQAEIGTRPTIENVLQVMRDGDWEEPSPAQRTAFRLTSRVPQTEPPERRARHEHVFRGVRLNRPTERVSSNT